MSTCRYPQHHSSGSGFPWAILIVIGLLIAAVSWINKHAVPIEHVAELIAVYAAITVTIVVIAAIVITRRARSGRHVSSAVVARIRWRHLARNTGLAKIDQHQADKIRRGKPVQPKVRHLKARIRPTADGIRAELRTIPGTGRAEIDAAAEHIRNEWQCARVHVEQAGPRKVIVHGLRIDPLAELTTPDDAPAGTYDKNTFCPLLYVGKDTAGRHRSLPLPGVTGITVAGLPGLGKSSLISSWLCQLAGTPAVQFAIADGKGGGDFEPWRDRAWLYAEDELPAALAMLEDVHAEMQRRLGSVLELAGHRNAWHAGPSESMPLLVVVLDECQSYLDVASYKGDAASETMARRCVSLTSRIVRKGRSVMCQAWLSTQKPTADSLPTSIRDNAALSLAYGLKTTDGCVAALGESIRQFPSYSPTQFGPGNEGVCVATLRTGTDPFSLLRTPEITEEFAADRAMATVACRRQLGARVSV